VFIFGRSWFTFGDKTLDLVQLVRYSLSSQVMIYKASCDRPASYPVTRVSE